MARKPLLHLRRFMPWMEHRPARSLHKFTVNCMLLPNKISCLPLFVPCRWESYSKQKAKRTANGLRSIKADINPENVTYFVSLFSDAEKKCLLEALDSKTTSKDENMKEDSCDVTKRQLRLVFIHNFVPFVGFGFLDNAIMILAGECIDLTIGVTLGISTMAAAALGNTISDIAGIGLAGSVEMLFLRIGLPVPALTPKQAEEKSTVVSSNLGKAFGIVLGCLIGMFPLLLLDDKPSEKELTNHDSSVT